MLKSLHASEIIELLDKLPKHGLLIKRQIRREASIKEIIKAFQQTQVPRIRAILCEILGKRRAKTAIPLLVECLDDASSAVRSSAAEALAYIGSSSLCDDLKTHFVEIEKEPLIRNTLAIALGASRCYESIPLLISALKESDPGLRRVAAWSLGVLKAQEANDALREALVKETEVYVRFNIEQALQLISENKDTE